MNTKEAFKIWQNKAPVNLYGPQSTASKAYSVFQHLLTYEEKMKIDVALAHSALGEGRQEFDNIAKKIKYRIFGQDES